MSDLELVFDLETIQLDFPVVEPKLGGRSRVHGQVLVVGGGHQEAVVGRFDLLYPARRGLEGGTRCPDCFLVLIDCLLGLFPGGS
jgi:hypothetical protein